jgi:tetratricopeptide (TPR) repeat protein
MGRHLVAPLIALALTPLRVTAQGPSPLDPTSWGVVLDVAATKQVKVRAGIVYQRTGTDTLLIDVYQPAGANARRPAVVFLNTIGDPPAGEGDPLRRWAIYRSWPRLIAAHGMVGISMDAERDRIQESLIALFRFLQERASSLGVDPDRIGVYAASANVSGATTYLFGDSAWKGIRAAVLYYGAPPDTSIRLRTDLPVLFVAAEGDVPRMGPGLGALWQRVLDGKLPWTLEHAAALPHGFDAFSDNDQARRLVRQTINFWKNELEAVPAPSWRPSEARAIVEATYWNQPARAIPLLGRWTTIHPDDGRGWLQFGRQLHFAGRLDEADSAYQQAARYGVDTPWLAGWRGMIQNSRQRWALAVPLFEEALSRGLETSQILGGLGYAQLGLGRYAEAAQSYERAFGAGIPPGRSTRGVAWYNLACAYARTGRNDQAFDALNKAVDEGMADRASYEQDEDLASLRGDARFKSLLNRMAGVARQP